MSKRSSKHAQAEEGGVAVMERPAVVVEKTEKVRKSTRDRAIVKLAAKAGQAVAEVEKVVAQVGASERTVVEAAKQMPALVRDELLAKQADEDKAEAARIEKLKASKKAAPRVIAKPQMAAEVQVGDMIATSYFRKPGSSVLAGKDGSWGALVQTVAMRGSLKGRYCRHEHPTSAEAVECAKSTIGALRAAA